MDCDSERIWKIVETQRHNVPRKKRSAGASLSLSDQLYDCYVDCSQRQNDKNFDKRFRNTSNLLQQLHGNQAKPSLVVNLYSDERGYSLALDSGEDAEEIFMPYEDDEIFSYLDNQEIPPVLTEVLSQSSHCHMHSGCVVCEVRNHRDSTPSSFPPYDSHMIMLRPTNESILQMVNEITSETGCSLEEQLALESRLLLATQPPICLDPNTEVVWVTNRLHYNRNKFNSPGMKRYFHRRSQARRARMYHTSLRPAPPELRLHNFLKAGNGSLKCSRPEFVDVWKRKKRVSKVSAGSVTSIARRVQELATALPEPPPTPTTPASDHTPSALPPLLHPRAPGQSLAEEFLRSGRHNPPSATPSHAMGGAAVGGASVDQPIVARAAVGGSAVGGADLGGAAVGGAAVNGDLVSGDAVCRAPPISLNLPHKATPTIVQRAPRSSLSTPSHTPQTPSLTVSLPSHPPPLSSISLPSQPPQTPSLTISLPSHPSQTPSLTMSLPSHTPQTPSLTVSIPRIFTSHSKTTPTPPKTSLISLAQPPTLTPSHPPTSLSVINTGRRRVVPTTSSTPSVVAMTAGKQFTFQHPAAAVKSSVAIVASGNSQVAMPTRVQLAPPKLRLLGQVSAYSGSTHHGPLVMPKLHRLTPSTLSSSPRVSTSLSAKATPTMPTLRPLTSESNRSSLVPKLVPRNPPKLTKL